MPMDASQSSGNWARCLPATLCERKSKGLLESTPLRKLSHWGLDRRSRWRASLTPPVSTPDPLRPVGIVPGSLVSIFGTALALNPGEAMAFPLPTQLRLTRVTIDGVPVPLLFVSPQQINFQAPFELTGSSVELQIISDAGASDLVTVPLISTQPGIFFDFATGLGAIRNNDDGTTILDRPARAGDFIQVFCTGLGEVVPTGQTGLPAPASPLSLTTRDPRVLIDGRDSLVTFSPHFQFDSDLPTFQRP